MENKLPDPRTERLTVDFVEGERAILKVYCAQVGRTQADVIRELTRGLRKKLTPEAKATLGDVLFELGFGDGEE